MQPLVGFFQSERKQRSALDSFFSVWGQWPIATQLLDLYDASRIAFDASTDANQAFQCFEKIYADLKSPIWGAFRSPIPGAKHWTARQIFEKLIGEFPEFSSYGPFNLLNFPESGKESRLEASLVQMRGIKEKKTYPHMTVSKVLHFYNPSLFPIYDTEMIENKVFKRFKPDIQEFCRQKDVSYKKHFYDEDNVSFVTHYIGWASSLLSEAHGKFMEVFEEWLANQPGSQLSLRRFDARTLYATAFEFIAIGACGYLDTL
jgi:hypothetical protein